MKQILLILILAFSLNACKPPPSPPLDTKPQVPEPIMENFVLQTVPSGATAKFSTGETCKTPCTLKKKSDEIFEVRVEKSGYKSVTASVTSNIRVIPGSGAKGKIEFAPERLSPNPLRITLEPSWSKK